jgi:zinc transport system permease protein
MLNDILQYDFLQNAWLAGILASVLCGVIGTFVVVKRLVFVSGGISHAAFGGLGLCYFFAWPPLLGALAVSVLIALILGLGGEKRLRQQDALTGMLWAVGMALGLVFIYLSPGYAPNLMSYLFGDILTVTNVDVRLMGWVTLATLAIIGIGFKWFVDVAFDETFARVQGIPVRGVLGLLLVLIAITIVLLIQVVGVTLVIALLTLPALMALAVSRHFPRVVAWAVVFALMMTSGGLILSYYYDVPSGATVVLVGFVMWALVAGTKRLMRG